MSDDDLIRRGDALAVVRPTGERPCDCRGCRGSLPTAEDWARWDAFSRAAAAIEALPAVTVGVKLLMWREEYQKWSADSYTATATGAGCTYIIASSTDDQNHDAIVQVKKAAAQADYEARIRAALEPVAAPDPAAIRAPLLGTCPCGMAGPCMWDQCKHPLTKVTPGGNDE